MRRNTSPMWNGWSDAIPSKWISEDIGSSTNLSSALARSPLNSHVLSSKPMRRTQAV